MPRVSIIMAVYNGEAYIEQAIRGVFAQTECNSELIVVDDGSRDRTATIVESLAMTDSRLRLIQQSNAGANAARNRGYAESSSESEYVIFFDHDDLWEKDTLELLSAKLDEDPGAVGAHGLLQTLVMGDEHQRGRSSQVWSSRWSMNGFRARPLAPDQPTTFAVLVIGNCLRTPGQLLIRRRELQAVGLFDPEVAPADDWDLWLRLSARGHIALVNRVVLHYRLHATNATLQKAQMWQAMKRVRKKLTCSPLLNEQQRKLVRLGKLGGVQQRFGWAMTDLIHLRCWSAAKHLRQMVMEPVRL